MFDILNETHLTTYHDFLVELDQLHQQDHVIVYHMVLRWDVELHNQNYILHFLFADLVERIMCIRMIL